MPEPEECLAESLAEQAKILLVDDRSENLVALEATLQSLGDRLVSVKSGPDALRQLLLRDFAVILLDAQMPGMSGFETAQLIRGRERNRHTPIIFLTAYSRDRENISQGYSLGAVDYITKPYDPDILRSKVRVFVELFERGEKIKLQQEQIRQSELREAERLREVQVWELAQQHMRDLNLALEARVAERTEQLVEANEELEAFCYSISHDLRAPLRAITSTSMILLEENEGKLEEDHVVQLQRQAHNSQRLANLIDDLLKLSRIGRRSMEIRPVDFTALAKEVAGEVINRGWAHTCEFSIEEGMEGRADPSFLRLLLENLMDNACKYSPNGGAIEVGRIAGDAPTFFVRDHGIGFDMKYEPKIFLPFERLVLETEFPGTGIGLASAQRIVKKHGGKIWSEAELGKGATFFFTLSESRHAPSNLPTLSTNYLA